MEENYKKGLIRILVTTSTLAVGVNLPCYLVIIKGTQGYKSMDGYTEYDYSEIC